MRGGNLFDKRFSPSRSPFQNHSNCKITDWIHTLSVSEKTMNTLHTAAVEMQDKAWRILQDTNIINLWRSIGATVNVVGSLKTGLLISNRDIDLHVYTDPFNLADSFSVMAKLAENAGISTINYHNLLNHEDRCLEWHAFYTDEDGQSWQLDMIHILADSPYAGYFEKVAERISLALTNETRTAILGIKQAIPKDKKVMAIEVYKAVIDSGIRDVEAFWQWKENNAEEGIVGWMP